MVTIVTLVVVVAMAVCLVGALSVARGIRLTEYTSHRSRGGLVHITFTVLATLVGGWMFFGLSAIGYEAGVVGCFIGLGYGIGLVLLGFCAKRIKAACDAHNCDTIDDLVGAKFGRLAQAITSLMNMMVFLAVMAAQFVAMAAFLNVFTDIQSDTAFYVAALVVIVYTVASGFKGVLFTDLWQFLVLSVSAVCIFLLLTAETSSGQMTNLAPEYFRGTGYGLGFLLGSVVLLPITLLCRSDMWQRISCARSHGIARKAFFIGGPALLVFYAMLTLVGMYARAALGPDQRPDISGFTYFLQALHASSFPAWASQLLLSVMALGVFAALLSTADSYINIIAVSVSKLIKPLQWRSFETAKAHQDPQTSATERSLLLVTRALGVLFGVLAVALAKAIPDIVDLIVGAASVLMIFLPAVLHGLFVADPQPRPWLVVPGLVLGFLVFLIFFFALGKEKIAFIPAAAVSGLSYGVARIALRGGRRQGDHA